MEQNLEERLAKMRAKYIENFPQDAAGIQAQLEAFKHLSKEEREEKVSQALQLLSEKKQLLAEKYDSVTDIHQKAEIKSHIDTVTEKITHFEEKLAMIQSDDFDNAKIDRLKRQIAQLELKRCRSYLDKKNSHKIDEKIAHKKERFKKIFSR